MAGSKRTSIKKTSRKTTAAAKSGPRVPGWLLLTAGIAIGVFIAMLSRLAPNVGTTTAAAPGKAGQEQASEKNKIPVFDFYTLLPESEVMVPDSKSNSSKAPAPKSTTPARSTPVREAKAVVKSAPASKASISAQSAAHFLLQAGSFRNAPDADRLKAQLILSGFLARVDPVTVRGGEKWYRVQLGPYKSEGEVRKVRNELAAQGMETMLLQQR